MPVKLVAWFLSIAVHGALVLALLTPVADGAALEEGTGDDIMVVEQGIALEGLANLGQDMMSTEAVEAPPMMSAVAQPLEQVEAVEEQVEVPIEEIQEVQPIEDMVLASEAGPESELYQPEQEMLDEPEPDVTEEVVDEPVKEPVEDPEEVREEQPLAPQLAAVAQQPVVAMQKSSGVELKGGNLTTALKVYQRSIWDHIIKRARSYPDTDRTGEVMVLLEVGRYGEVVLAKVIESSGSKMLDAAALTAVKNDAPYPPIPPDLGMDTVQTKVPYRYNKGR